MRTVCEALPTLGTFKGPFPCVGSLVLDQIRALAEMLPAIITPVRLHSCVGPLVGDEIGASTEAFVTFEACIGLLAGVSSLVHY